MKFLSKAVLIFFALFFSQPLVAEWKTSAWKAGDNAWMVVSNLKSCTSTYEVWKIDGVKGSVVKLIRKNDNNIRYKELSKMRAFSTEKSATEYIESTDKRCKEQNALKEKYENS